MTACLPGKVVKVLDVTETKHLLQFLHLFLASRPVDLVNVVDDPAHIAAAVLGHTLLNGGEVLPLQELPY